MRNIRKPAAAGIGGLLVCLAPRLLRAVFVRYGNTAEYFTEIGTIEDARMRRRWFERVRQFTHGELAHKVFWIGIILKTINAVLEVAGGIVLLSISRQSIVNLVYTVFRHELAQDPADWLANFVLREALNLSPGMKLFAAIYLLTHGLIKLGLIGAIWRSKLWAYPLAGVVFSLFVVYQVYRFASTYSIVMLLLTVLDLIIIALLFPEYGRVKEEIAQRNGHT